MIFFAIYPLVCTACFFIGVFCGKRAERMDREAEPKDFDEIEIAHVGYDAEQCGREK